MARLPPGTRDLAGSRALLLGLARSGSDRAGACRASASRWCPVPATGRANGAASSASFDWIVLAVPARRDAGMIGAADLAAMKPEAVLVNFARADCVDQDALIAALRERRIAAACSI